MRRNPLLTLVLVAVSLLLAGCPISGGAAESAGRAAGEAAERGAAEAGAAGRAADDAARSLPRPEAGAVPVPDAGVGTAAAVGAEQNRLVGPYVGGLSFDDARDVVKAACMAKDIADLGQATTWDEAAGTALVNFGGRATLRYRVAGLAEDLETAKTSRDQVAMLAVAGICEAA